MSQDSLYVMKRIAEAGAIAVFKIDGKVKTLAPAGERFERLVDECFSKFVGVYDGRATQTMVQQDLDTIRH